MTRCWCGATHWVRKPGGRPLHYRAYLCFAENLIDGSWRS